MSSVSVSVPETNTRFARSPVGSNAYSGARSSSDSLNVNVASLNSAAKTRRATSRVGAPLIYIDLARISTDSGSGWSSSSSVSFAST